MKNTMKNILACLLPLGLAAVCTAQQIQQKKAKPHPDLSGTWVLDKSKTAGGKKFAYKTLVITHRDPELKITLTYMTKGEQVTREEVFYTDGRGESNPIYSNPIFANSNTDSDTKWEGRKVVAYTCTRSYKGDRCQGLDSWKWELSEDGQRLTFRTTFVQPSVYVATANSGPPPIGQIYESRSYYRRAP